MSFDTTLEMLRPPHVHFGSGQIRALAGHLTQQAGTSRPFVLCDEVNLARLDQLGIGPAGVFGEVRGEPDTRTLEVALESARRARPDVIIGFGGGSVLDLAKLVAVLVASDLRFEDISGPNRAPARKVRLVQIPTTAGTGSEVGTRALITDPETLSKIATESRHMLADMVILDAELTVSLPPSLTAAVGIDALAHCVEAYTSKRSHPVVDAYALEGIRLIGHFLPRAVAVPDDLEARAAMLLAAFYGGVCLGPVNTTAGHAIAYPLGTRCRIPHGLANALVFAHVLAFNAPARPEKTEIICRALSLDFGEASIVESGAAAFCNRLGLTRRLADFGISRDDLPILAQEAHAIRRLLDYNPRPISPDQIQAIYEAAY